MHGSRGGCIWSSPPSLNNYKAIWFLSNTVPDPLKKISKLPRQPPSARKRNAISGHGPRLEVFGPSSTKLNVVRVRPTLKILSGSAHVFALWCNSQCRFLIGNHLRNKMHARIQKVLSEGGPNLITFFKLIRG